ncbi:hypothetical protein [Arthrobacter sp. ok362]|uniref:hypothetical protein n=1 Tax=Arthrobacter sp. ok362 TaxID=1761745 RepID=UPI0008843770|nr:hypothetical protein [Arthrobacter sp. ok362]SDK61104.1 hypothetical protein SAMN04487913_10299 [Arthrobacter sp. ok362]
MATTLAAGIRYAAAALTLGVVLLTGTGCSYDNPAETAKITPATNGINTVVGPMKLADMLVLSHGADQPGRIIGTIFNTSSTDAIVTISGASGSKVSIPVKANGHTSLAQPPAMMLEPTAGSPGSMVTVRVNEDSAGTSADVQLPVLDSTLSEYQSYMPPAPASGAPSTTQPGSTASPGTPATGPSSSSPSPSPSPSPTP